VRLPPTAGSTTSVRASEVTAKPRRPCKDPVKEDEIKRKALAVVTLLIAALFVGVAPADAAFTSLCAVTAYTFTPLDSQLVKVQGKGLVACVPNQYVHALAITAGPEYKWTSGAWSPPDTDTKNGPANSIQVIGSFHGCVTGTWLFRTSAWAEDTNEAHSPEVYSATRTFRC